MENSLQSKDKFALTGINLADQPPIQILGGAVGMTDKQVAEFRQVVHSGPLPSARELQNYAQAHPEAVPWILAEAKADADHARDMERRGMEIARKDAQRRRNYPFFVILAALTICGGIAYLNVYIGAAGVFGAMIALGVAYFQGAAGQHIGPNNRAAPAKE